MRLCAHPHILTSHWRIKLQTMCQLRWQSNLTKLYMIFRECACTVVAELSNITLPSPGEYVFSRGSRGCS